MKKILTLTFAVVLVSFACTAQAAWIDNILTEEGDNYINALVLMGLTEADGVTGMSVEALPGTGEFLNFNPTGTENAAALEPSAASSFTNALLPAPGLFGGQGWTIVDGSDNVAPPSGPGGIGYAASKPGSFMVADGVFLSNFMLPKTTQGSAVVILLGADGNAIEGGRLETTLGMAIPEPSTFAILGIALVGLGAFLRKR